MTAATPYAVISPAGAVLNIVLWDGTSTFDVSPNTLVSALNQPNAQPGGTYAAGVFTAPAAPPTPQGIMFINSPLTGARVSLPNAPQPQNELYAVFQPAAAIAALTLDMPPAPADGDDLYLFSTKAVAAMQLVPAPGQAFINIPAGTFALAAFSTQHCVWSSQLSSWFRL